MQFDFPYTLHNLDNNLDVLLVPMPQSPSVTVAIFAGVGSRHELKEQSGIAHIIEHMAFKGTTNRPTRQAISREIANHGGTSNAATGYEFTYYYVKMPAYHWEKALDIVSDLTLNPIFPENELEKEKTVIVQEYTMYEDNPHARLVADFRQNIWPEHPLGRRISGIPETILSVTKNDLVDFRSKYYTRNNLLVAISGAFEEEKVLSFVKNYFADLHHGITPEYEKADKIIPGERVTITTKEQDSVDIVLGVKGFNRSQEKKLEILEVMNTVFGGNDTSRLFQNIRDEHGLTYYIGSGHTDYIDDGLFYIRAGVAKERLNDAVVAVMKEIDSIMDSPITQEELKTAKEYLKGDLLLELETSNDLLRYYAFQKLLEPNIKTPGEVISLIDNVTIEEVRSVAQELFSKDLYLGVLGPVGATEANDLHTLLR